MDIWIIQDGEKTGPIHDFEVRRKIENGELTASTPAWHEGLAEWTQLEKIGLFEHEFDLPIAGNELPGPDEPPPNAPNPQLPPPDPPSERPAYARRFWARWFDLYLFAGIWWITMWAVGRDIEAILQNAWIILFHYVPWFILESFLIQRFGTTPGKWLLGLRVSNDDGSQLNLAEATRRSMRILFMGVGFGWGLLALICQIMAFFTTKRLGRPLWDHAGGHRVTTTPLQPLRIVGFVFLLFCALYLQTIVVYPHVVKQTAKTFPALKEQFEKNPPWHLPDNSR